MNQLLEVGDRSEGMNRYKAIEKWTNHLKGLHTSVVQKLAT